MNQLLNKLMNKLEGLRWRFGSSETRVKILRKRGVRISEEGGGGHCARCIFWQRAVFDKFRSECKNFLGS